MSEAATAMRQGTMAGRLLPALALALLVALPMAASAAERPGHRPREEPPARTEPPARIPSPPALGMREPPRSRPGVSMDQAIAQVERRYKARVVRADQAESNGRRVYVLRLLSEEGRVSKVQVDAETGEVR